MPGNKFNDEPEVLSSRVGRLLRERELRRSSITPSFLDGNDHSPGTEIPVNNSSYVEQYLDEGCDRPVKQRLLVVANRLPVSAVRRGEDSWSLEVNAGGLVSALLGVKEFEARWIGWAGVNVPDEIGQRALTRALAEKRCIPVFLDEEIVHQYYNGYCNNILWPLFHYLGLPQEDRLATTRSFQSQFSAYQKANKMFAEVVHRHYEEGDVVWCHDYHLMFLPKYLKDYNSKMKVGWFLHTPFPSSEIHRTLPSRSELLRAVLAADLVGFHTYDYARHFVSACTRILGLEGTPEGVEDQGRLTRVAAFPIGIDSERFIRALKLRQVQEHIKELNERFSGRKVMLGVDRLDMIKGIPQKILAFEKFLEENPYWRDKAVLLQIAVPTRTDVPEYQKLTSQVHEIVGRINGRFGSLTAVPIHHLVSIFFSRLTRNYSNDTCLVMCFHGAAWFPSINKTDKWDTKNSKYTAYACSELNDTVLEAQQRIRKAPPQLVFSGAIKHFMQAHNLLIILGFNGTLTEPFETPGRRGDQIKEMELKLHPELKGPLTMLCSDPNTTIMVLSGSDRSVLDDNFGDYNMWLAAENGMFLRSTKGEWMTTMLEHLNMDWVESVQHVFEYFTERTPGSHFERRETSLVWNYKYADVEFGRLQARDMLQHLWTGPISNSSVDVVQGSRSVEIRAVGVSKGAGIDRILGEIVHSKATCKPIDYILCIGHFLGKDEDVYTFFEPELPLDNLCMPRNKVTDAIKLSIDKRQFPNLPSGKSSSKTQQSKSYQQNDPNSDRKSTSGNGKHSSTENTSWNVLDLKKENYFSCAVGRTRTNARYLLNTSDDVVAFLKELTEAAFH
ncbi:trehalose-phosphatase/synthase 2 [Striga hermonthica]|uniref:alpha,alpha-trehalose-phosphate synthase (UDP-forming) n=1 Tax=Striga hermonthica TaxID=68872 RepID=A0A9N7MXB7_STRHE|nr:trehalose-phosphatase/synthase 2 [Striga hermonthica]